MSEKHVVITGGNRGIGLELIRRALGLGHRVTALVRNPEGATALKALSHPKLNLVLMDVTDPHSIKSAAATIKEGVDILINNAGLLIRESGKLDELDVSTIQKSMDVNLMGPVYVTQTLLPNLRKSKQPRVVNVSSQMGSMDDNASGGYYGYRISKAALNMFTKNLSREQADWIVVCVHPGWVKTEMGGPQAPMPTEESALHLWKLIEGLSAKDSGHFLNYTGQSLPW